MIPIMEECEHDFLLLSKLLLTSFCVLSVVWLIFSSQFIIMLLNMKCICSIFWIIYYNIIIIFLKYNNFNTYETIQFHIGDKIIHLSIDGKHNVCVPMVQDFEATWLDWCHNLDFKYIINRESSQEYTHNFHHYPQRFFALANGWFHMLRLHLPPFDYVLLLLLTYWNNLIEFPRLATFFYVQVYHLYHLTNLKVCY